jgi:glycosyltransferase involved in cell wall biosynthesis
MMPPECRDVSVATRRTADRVSRDERVPLRPDALRALLVSYVFPPTGGVGGARVSKLAKYLPAHGVVPAILTARNPSVPLLDTSLERDVAPDLEIARAWTLEPRYGVKKAVWTASATHPPTVGAARAWTSRLARLARQVLVPDPQVLWQPDAHRALIARIARRPADDVVFITAPPFSTFLLGPLARLRPGTALVLDYRDEWLTTRNAYEMIAGRAAAAMGGLLERTLLRLPHVITTATEAFRQCLLDRFRFLDPARVVTIPNGYDPDDFPAELPEPPRDRFVVTFAGTVFKLTSPRGLLGGLRRLHARAPELAKSLEVRFMGRVVESEVEAFAGSESLGVVRTGFAPKDEVMLALAASHLTLCMQGEVAGVERIYPAKVFELMYLGRPCVTISPPGALTELAARHRLGPVLHPRDEEGIATLLEGQLRAFRAGTFAARSEAVDIDRFDRRRLAGEFAGVFRQAVSRARGAR